MAPSGFKNEKLFGTDGIRGTPGVYPLTDGMIFKIGISIAKVITYYRKQKSESPKVVIARDTRLTGRRIETLLSDAITFHGIDIYLADTITTPGLAYLVRELGADMGIMISASHNKATDNGIKLFNEKGCKLSAKEEEWIEKVIFSTLIHTPGTHVKKQMGRIVSMKKAYVDYVEFLLSTVKGLDLSGMSIALDCGCGAASEFGASVFKKLGADVVTIHDKPSGEHINVGGAVNPESLRKLVVASGAHVGIALDGDGDRSIFVDEKGNVLDGDHILLIVGSFLSDKNMLPQNMLVATIMSNLGLKKGLEKKGVKALVTKVGDKHVLETLIKNNLTLGGEQSGHIVFLDYLPSPDGLLTALQMLNVMKETGIPLSKLAKGMVKFPQILVNVKVNEKRPFDEMSGVKEKMTMCNQQLDNEGRILLRYSGTENLARVMVEGKDEQTITNIANAIADSIREEIGVDLEDDYVK